MHCSCYKILWEIKRPLWRMSSNSEKVIIIFPNFLINVIHSTVFISKFWPLPSKSYAWNRVSSYDLLGTLTLTLKDTLTLTFSPDFTLNRPIWLLNPEKLIFPKKLASLLKLALGSIYNKKSIHEANWRHSRLYLLHWWGNLSVAHFVSIICSHPCIIVQNALLTFFSYYFPNVLQSYHNYS